MLLATKKIPKRYANGRAIAAMWKYEVVVRGNPQFEITTGAFMGCLEHLRLHTGCLYYSGHLAATDCRLLRTISIW
jgi:hypothetical protein